MPDSSYLIYVTQSKLTFELLLKVDLISMKTLYSFCYPSLLLYYQLLVFLKWMIL